MQIAHIDTGKDLRGGQWQLLTLARGLRERGHEQVIVCQRHSELERRASIEGFRTQGMALSGMARLGTIRRLRDVLHREEVRVIHAHDGRGQTVAWLASCGLNICRVASRRVTFLPRSLLLHRLKYDRTCHGVIAVSVYVRNLLIKSGIPALKIAVIPDGIDFPEKLPNPSEKLLLRRSWQFSSEDFVIGHAGAFTAEKGQETAIQAFQLLKLPHSRLLLAGDGPTRTQLENRYAADGRIRFLGHLADISPFIDTLDLFVMPSRSEGLGSSALVALSRGVPVIATRTGGLPEIIEEGVNGWLVYPSSPRDLAEAIRHAASGLARLREMGERARDKARQFTGDIMTERTVDFYQELMKRFHLQ